MKALLNTNKVDDHSILDRCSPMCQTWRLAIEHVVISFLPKAPSTNQEDLHKEWLPKLILGNINLLVNIRMLIPINAKGKPPANH